MADDRLAGRAALITGAAQGLGLAIARALHEAGAHVTLADVNPDIAGIAKSVGVKAHGVALDVRSEAAFDEAIARIVKTEGALDIMVNNAALTISRSMWDIDASKWDDVLAVNLRGVFFGCRAAGRVMRERKTGRIINLSSLAGQRGGVVAGAHYSASKAGILAVTKCFAQELGSSGVTVNAIAPAAIDGPMARAMPAEKVQALAKTIPVGRLGNDREVGAAAVYLASDDSGYVTGSTLDLNGGVLMR